ncbi:MAG: hypothetical protein HXX81_05875 [Campylobacterales bacterium]|nr:hypothetical protein [Campylobacterales bacterium]
MQLSVNIQNDVVAYKVLWFLEHLKDDGVSVEVKDCLDIEAILKDEDDYKYFLDTKKRRENGEKTYLLDDVIKEFR